MLRSCRLLFLRATTVLTVTALMFSMVGLAAAAPVPVHAARPPASVIIPTTLDANAFPVGWTACNDSSNNPTSGCTTTVGYLEKPIGPYVAQVGVLFNSSGSECHDATHFQVTGTVSNVLAGTLYILKCNGSWLTYSWNDAGSVPTALTSLGGTVAVKGYAFGTGGTTSGFRSITWGAVEFTLAPTPTPTITPTPSNTPTPTNTATPTNTPTPDFTQTQSAAQTQTQGPYATQTQNAGATQTRAAQETSTAMGTPAPPTSVSPSGNLIRNWDFATPPRVAQSYWADMNRVVQSPYTDVGLQIDGLPYGSCGYEYWTMSRFGGSDGRIWQDFGWTGGPMYINFEAQTNNYVTRGEVTLTNIDNGAEETVDTFSNGSGSWLSFKYLTGSQPAGQYRLGFSYNTVGPAGGLAVDNVNVRRGYWGNDCPANNYHGQIQTTTNATATPIASPTANPLTDNTPINQNCDFEQGWSGYSHNQAARLFYTGGATGPTYAYMFTVYGRESDPLTPDLLGRINVPFAWPGGQYVYVSYWTGPGTRATINLVNHFTGYNRQLQSPDTAQTYNGWVKRSQGFYLANGGNYVLEMSSPYGQIAAIDGVAVSAGGFASGPCSSSNTTSDNNATATQHLVNTQVAGTATTDPAVVGTANAVFTQVAGAYATYYAGQIATAIANGQASQTAQVPATQTRAAVATATRRALQTATAQGTPPAPTRTAPPQPTAFPGGETCTLDPLEMVWVCPDPPTVPAPSGPSDAQLTAIALTLTAEANAQATFWAAAQQTANVRATGTAAYQQTQAYAPIIATQQAQQTQAAAANQTAVALHATQTAIANAIDAQATANVAATQHQQQAQATQTAVAGAATASAGNATQQAAATTTAQAYATQYAAVTATAVAQITQDAVNRANATSTAYAQATANAAATGVALATQQQQQSQATQTAVAQQTALAATANPTTNAQATTTAQAYATTYAQVTATAQAQATSYSATQQASGTTTPGDDLPPVDPRPEPSPGVDCIRPDSPLQVANWIDYEVCRVLTWFAWSPANSEQLLEIESVAGDGFPFGLLLEIKDTLGVFGSWLTSLPWCDTGFCQDQPLAPLNLEASGILNGNWDFSEGTPYYSDQCTLLMAPLLGPYIQSGACFCMNVACALGILPWFQLVFNVLLVLMLVVYVQRTWLTSAHT